MYKILTYCLYDKQDFRKKSRGGGDGVRSLIKAIKELFEIKESTPSFVVSGLIGCAVSAILILIRILIDAFY